MKTSFKRDGKRSPRHEPNKPSLYCIITSTISLWASAIKSEPPWGTALPAT
jgi:hypothetical protein